MIRAPIKVHGGKSYLAKKFLPLWPTHDRYVDVYGGGGSVLLSKPKVAVEVYNDLDWKKVNVMRAIRDHVGDLSEILEPITACEDSFLTAKAYDEQQPSDSNAEWSVRDAACYIIRNRLSRGGMGQAYTQSTRLRGGQDETANMWQTYKALLPKLSERLQGVSLVCRPAADALGDYLYDERYLVYLDPPYLPHTRTATKVYGQFEMSYQDHVALIDLVVKARCAIAVSGYHSELYDNMLADFETHEFGMPNNAGQGKTKQRRTEVLWVRQNRSALRMQGAAA